MQTILKYALTGGVNYIDLPEDARVLHADVQGSGVYLWALLDTDAPTTCRTFCVFATGERNSAEAMDYIGTIMADGGSTVLHVFEVAF